MKNLLLLSAVVFASAVAFMNCGPAGKCGPANCGGCCDSSGTCVTATSATACGKQGETCNTCTAPTNVCIAGACAVGTVGGGGGTTGGGGGTTGGGGGTTGGGGGATGGGGGSGGGCEAIDFSQAQSVGAQYNLAMGNNPPNHQSLVMQPSSVSGKFDFIGIESWYFGPNSSPTFPQTVPVPSPAGSTYGDCADCVWLDQACDSNDTGCARSYFAEGGSLVISTATRAAVAGTFSATATNLAFTEWDFMADSAVASGRCATVATVSVNASWDKSDGGMDAGTDAGMDAGTDAGVDVDAGMDAGIDAGLEDAGTDAGTDDAGIDAGP